MTSPTTDEYAGHWERIRHLYPGFDSWMELCDYKRVLFSKLQMPKGRDYYDPHGGQELLHFRPWSYHVANWGRRGGKTQGAAAETTFEASFPNRQIWVAAPTYILTDKVFRLVYHWIVNLEIFGPNTVKRALYNPRGERLIELRFKGGNTIIEGKTCENPKSLLGEGNHFLVLDEAAQIADKNIWETYLEPTLVDYKGRALFISTPRGYNWFYELHNEYFTDKGREEGWFSSHITSADNPFLDADWIQEKKRRTDPSTFRQEYEASFEVKKGLVYPDFQDGAQSKHLFEPEQQEISKYWTHYRAIDPGLANPTACIWAAVDPNQNVWVYDEYEVAGGLVKEHADNIRAKTRFPIVTTLIDPAAAKRNDETGRSTADNYRDNGIYTVPAVNDVPFGIQSVGEYLRGTLDQSSPHPQIFISRRLMALRRTLVQYEWDETASLSRAKNDPDRPRKYKDHLADALRYLLASKPRFIPVAIRNEWEHPERTVDFEEEVGEAGAPTTGL